MISEYLEVSRVIGKVVECTQLLNAKIVRELRTSGSNDFISY